MNVLAISLQDLKDLHRIETNRLIYENRHHRTTRFFSLRYFVFELDDFAFKRIFSIEERK